jgi:hypothetical protein
MTYFYRSTGFVPGDRLLITIADWKNAVFNIERVPAGAWEESDLHEWLCAAEAGFQKSFEDAGPEFTTEEQIAWAYFYGGARMRTVPAYSLEDFLYKKTDKIETAQFGIETRLWYAGKEIPDYEELRGVRTQSDETPIERMLREHGVPISEFVVQAYVRDSLFRRDDNLGAVLERIVPRSIRLNRWETEGVAAYVIETFEEFEKSYSIFTDQKTGPLRQCVGELHTAVIELAAQLAKSDVDPHRLPHHVFITLSQIQRHAAAVLETLDLDEEPPAAELETMYNSIESMCDTFDDTKDMIEKSFDTYRRGLLSLVKSDAPADFTWRTVQISIGGTDVWRRLVIPQSITLADLSSLILALFNWSGALSHQFVLDLKQQKSSWFDMRNNVKEGLSLSELIHAGLSELVYDYGPSWTVKIMLLAPYNAQAKEKAHCVTGENAPPPEEVEGPLRYRRFVQALESSDEAEQKNARAKLGAGFHGDRFSVAQCNEQIKAIAERFDSGVYV